MSESVAHDELLARAVGWVFILVAAADGKVDRKEVRRFEELLSRQDAFDSDWMKRGLESLSGRAEPVVQDLSADPDRAVPELEQVATQCEEALPADQARAFKHDLLVLGKAIAQASGGALGLKNPIDPSEAGAIGRLATVLRFQ